MFTLLALLINLGLVAIALCNADRFTRLMGRQGLRGVSKLIALLLAAIAISLIRRGWQGGNRRAEMTVPAPGTSAGRLTMTLSVVAILVIYALQTHMAPREMLLPPMRGDQAAYLEYAKQMRLSGYAFEGDRNRMPLYPFLLSLIYRDGMDDAQFLEKARTFNINLTIVLLLGLFWIFRKFFPPFYSVALLATAAFGLYIYRARVVHVEPLFYFIGFAMFLLLVRMLVAPGFVLAIAAGVISGLAYLTKASALAALPIWIVIFLAQSFFIARANAQFSMRDLHAGSPSAAFWSPVFYFRFFPTSGRTSSDTANFSTTSIPRITCGAIRGRRR